MDPKIKWLEIEANRWVKEGIITSEQATKILGLYSTIPSKVQNWITIIFSCIGVTIIGLGVILVIAYNWDQMHRFVKLAIILFSLIITYSVAVFFRFHKEKYFALSEALFLLGAMLYGAGIWLVAQTYHINEHYPNGLLVWGIGTVFLAWVLRSSPLGALSALIFTIWSATERWNFNHFVGWSWWIILLTVLPLSIQNRSLWFFTGTLISLVLSILFNIEKGELFLLTCVSIGSLLSGLGILFQNCRLFPKSGIVLTSLGSICYWTSLLFSTFPRALAHLSFSYLTTIETIHLYLFFFSSLLSWIVVILHRFMKFLFIPPIHLRFDHLFFPISTFLMFCSLFIFPEWKEEVCWLFNLIYLTQTIGLVYYGCQHLSIFYIVFGIILLSILTFVRYIDLFQSSLSRGITFLIVGTVIFFIGIYYTKQKRSLASKDTSKL